MLDTVTALRYITPLREGGSLPALIEADDGERYVMKFFGAGQGPRALLAELLGGEIARALGLQVPELKFIQLLPELGNAEPDPEIQDLLRASHGLNLGLRFLPEAYAYNPLREPKPDPDFAALVVLLDAVIQNVDRTPRNPNLLIWQQQIWLIDHGAAFFFQHNWPKKTDPALSPFQHIKEHVLLAFADGFDSAMDLIQKQLNSETIAAIVGLIPDAWLPNADQLPKNMEPRFAYTRYLKKRIQNAEVFLQEIAGAQAKRI